MLFFSFFGHNSSHLVTTGTNDWLPVGARRDSEQVDRGDDSQDGEFDEQDAEMEQLWGEDEAASETMSTGYDDAFDQELAQMERWDADMENPEGHSQGMKGMTASTNWTMPVSWKLTQTSCMGSKDRACRSFSCRPRDDAHSQMYEYPEVMLRVWIKRMNMHYVLRGIDENPETRIRQKGRGISFTC